ncbi:MAG: neutral zinc metallopeptidase [Proteobacteria bacterium]|nr:neutral zinc metallopeptidase [Pseudomonadota bacterium]
MRLGDERESDYIEDRRGMPGGGLVGGGIGTILLVLAGLYFGVDPSVILGMLQGGGPPVATHHDAAPSAQHDPARRFVGQVLADTEDTWSAVFRQHQRSYAPPRLVLYTGAAQSACGTAQAAVGPFYCPNDRRVYLDLGFFDELKRKFGAPGDFAQAYVIAHEIGHHVQNLLGTLGRVDERRHYASAIESNQLSVRLELQADCYAGVWAHQANRSRHILEQGDIAAGLTAAAAVGDDRLQLRARGYAVPESFTHGSSAQRVQWFKTGLETGDLAACNTFSSGGVAAGRR